MYIRSEGLSLGNGSKGRCCIDVLKISQFGMVISRLEIVTTAL